jgi:transposase-like protein
MQNTIKRQHSPEFKSQVAIEAIKEVETIAQIASKHSIHPTQINKWKKIAQDGLAILFSGKQDVELKKKDELIEQLYKKIGKREVELDWLKKKTGLLDN